MFSFWKKKRSLKSEKKKKYDKEQHPNAKLKKVLKLNEDFVRSPKPLNDESDTTLKNKENTFETIDLSDPSSKGEKQSSTIITKSTVKSISELRPTEKRNNYTQVRISPLNLRKDITNDSGTTNDECKPKVIKMTLKYIERPKQIEYVDKTLDKESNPVPANNLQIRRIQKNTNSRSFADTKVLQLNLNDKKPLNVSVSPPKPNRTFAYNQINYYYSPCGDILPKTVVEKQLLESPDNEDTIYKIPLVYNNNDLSKKVNDKKHNSYQDSVKNNLTSTDSSKVYTSSFNTVLSRPATFHPTIQVSNKEPYNISKTEASNLESGSLYGNKNPSLLNRKSLFGTKNVGWTPKNVSTDTNKYLQIPVSDKISRSSSSESLCAKLRSTGIKTSTGSVGKKYYKFGERGSGTKSISQPQDFHRLRDECLSRGVLFEDPDFHPTDSSLFYSKRPDRHFEWRRPSEIVDNPRLFVEGFSRFDVQQGELGDCWLLAAVANLTLSRKLFFQIVPDDQSFVDKYAGIFHFRFWQYGRWIDVVIDDRLPTYRGELVFLHSSEANEFWSALLEKAYAKLHGSYEALKGGSTCEAMEDFTGGVTEMYELNNAPPNLFQILVKGYERNSLMGCSIEPDPNVLEAETPEGLIRGHAYSITRVKYVDIQTPNTVGKIPLIRLRNPWGNEAEWKGAWSDKSPEWRFISQDEKDELGLTFDDDGEFWMSYRDFQKYFDRLEICNLSPDSLTDEDIEIGKKKWEVSVYEGDWVRGVTAGGCRNYLDTFWHNPQYNITLTEVDDDDDENKCTVIVALMQKNRRALRNTGADCLTIGFAIYYLPNPDRVPKPLDLNFFKYNASVARSPSFINLREVSCRFKLPPGTYCIVPSTFEPHEEAEFLLRVFSENKNHMEENDEDVGTCNMDDRVTDVPEPTPQADDKVREFFLRLAGDDMEVDWMELKEILDYAMRNELPAYKRIDEGVESGAGGNESGSDCGSILMTLLATICSVACKDTPLADMFSQSNDTTATSYQPAGIIETQNKGFSKDVCRSMIAMMDKDGSGKLGFEEFKKLWIDIRNWKAVFKLYDKDQSGVLSAFELRQALNSAGYKLNNHILGTLVHRYGTRDGYIAFDDFIMCAVKLKTMIDNPDEYNRFMNEGAQLSYGGYGYNYT